MAGPSPASSPVPYLGCVATGCGFPNGSFPGSVGEVSLQGETYHIARDDMDAVEIGVPNFFVNIYDGLFHDTPLGADGEWMASVCNLETGEITDMKWNGGLVGVVPDGTIGYSDLTPLKSRIERGKVFSVLLWTHNMAGAPYYSDETHDLGQKLEFSGGRSISKTSTGGMVGQNVNLTLRPCSISAVTMRPCIYGIGDSRMAGYQDQYDRTRDVGEVFRSIGPSYGYCNGGIPGERLENYKNSGQVRLSGLSRFSHVICNLGGNDIINTTRTEMEIAVDLITVWNRAELQGKDLSQSTIAPFSSSSGAVSPRDMLRVSVNNFIRSTPAPLARHLEIASVNETYRDSGSNIDAYYADPIHPNRLGYIHVQQSQVIRPELFL